MYSESKRLLINLYVHIFACICIYIHICHLTKKNQKNIHSVFDLTIYDFEKIALLKQIKCKAISILKMALFFLYKSYHSHKN